MATGTAGSTARKYHTQQVHFLRKDFTFADDGDTLVMGKIPAGSVILKGASGVNVHTLFNGGSTNTLDIGASTDSGTDNFGGALALGTVDFVPLDVTGTYYVSVDTTIVMLVTATANATTGVGQAVISYIPNM